MTKALSGFKSGITNTKVRMNHIAGAADFSQVFEVSRETLERLEIYATVFRAWQKTINLVAPSTVDDVWNRHFADSAQLVALAPIGAVHWLDLGSGGGFPGLVAGILLAERAGCRLTLIESDARKCAFLREVVRQTGLGTVLPVDILSDRIETAANTTKVGRVDVVSARALAPLAKLLVWCEAYFGPSTVALLPKGRAFEDELADARRIWAFESEVVGSRVDVDSRILVVRRLRRI
jgi:16S rRNA (guanine527-N7)-methyltransferase